MGILLKKFSRKHLNISREWMNNKELCCLFNRRYKYLSRVAQMIWYKKLLMDKTQVTFGIEVNKVYVGNIGLKNIDRQNKKAEYYIFIGDKSYRGKGVGENSTQQLLKYVRKNLHLHKIYLCVDKDNIAARRLYKKVGFIEEGVLKDELILENKFITMVRMAYFYN